MKPAASRRRYRRKYWRTSRSPSAILILEWPFDQQKFAPRDQQAVAVVEIRCDEKNLACIDFSILLNGVMTIADEVDSQLSQAMDSFIEEALLEATRIAELLLEA